MAAAKHICCTCSPFPVHQASSCFEMYGIMNLSFLESGVLKETCSLPIRTSLTDIAFGPAAIAEMGTNAPSDFPSSESHTALPKASLSDVLRPGLVVSTRCGENT